MKKVRNSLFMVTMFLLLAIKIPITFLSYIMLKAEDAIVEALEWFVIEIWNENIIDGWNEAMQDNSNALSRLAKYYFSKKIEL